MKIRLLNLHYGNRGFLLTLDMSIALFIVGIMLVSSLFFIAKTSKEEILLLQQSKIMHDVFAVMDYNKAVDSTSRENIKSNLNNLLPKNYKAGFRLECKNKIIQDLNITPNSFISSGERIIVTDKLDYCIMRYWLWQD